MTIRRISQRELKELKKFEIGKILRKMNLTKRIESSNARQKENLCKIQNLTKRIESFLISLSSMS